MTEVNWRELKEGERVKVEFEATVMPHQDSIIGFEIVSHTWTAMAGEELDAAKITRIERPWKVGDRFKRNYETWEVIADWRPTNHVGPLLPCWTQEYGIGGFTAAMLSTVTRLEPSDDR